ncbi:MAG: hypothetical protein WC878_04400 [Candidatus Paceibacterota bacterium]|jgi:hypothetical protein
MKKIAEQFLKGYRLAYDNLVWGATLPVEKRTFEEYAERMEWQNPKTIGLDGFSRTGGWICLILHFSLALRMHKATNRMLKDKAERGL